MKMRWFKPVQVPDGAIVVRALNKDQFLLWCKEQPPSLPGQRRLIFADSVRAIEGLRPSAVVMLPGWERHPSVPAVDRVLQRTLVMQRPVPRIYVSEVR